MNNPTSETIKVLRDMHSSELKTYGNASETYSTAADLIENQQAQLTDLQHLVHSKSEQLSECQRDNDRLREQLSASANREQAAVECITSIETYLELGSARYIKRTIDEWRGPQEAREGEQE